MPSKGFLLRGTLRPSMGTTTGSQKPMSVSQLRNHPLPTGNSTFKRIPSSITLKRNNGR